MQSLTNQLPTLGPRLQSIFELVAQAQEDNYYHYIWDCCCDHGYLGLQLLKHQLCETLYFVDQLPHLIEQLNLRLQPFPSDRYKTIAADAAALQFEAGKRHLVILAGVGGEHTIDIIKAIEDKHSERTIDFIFCPATTQYNLREYLASKTFALAHESIASEKGRDYEVIYVKGRVSTKVSTLDPQSSMKAVSLIGEMWDGSNAYHHRYLSKLITHYERQTLGSDNNRPKQILARYQQRREEINAA